MLNSACNPVFGGVSGIRTMVNRETASFFADMCIFLVARRVNYCIICAKSGLYCLDNGDNRAYIAQYLQ